MAYVRINVVEFDSEEYLKRDAEVLNSNAGDLFRCCQTKFNASQSTTITQTYEAQIWNHSMRAALRLCL